MAGCTRGRQSITNEASLVYTLSSRTAKAKAKEKKKKRKAKTQMKDSYLLPFG